MHPAIATFWRNRACTAYAFLIILHIALVWAIPHFPTQDGPSHIYNLSILHDLINGEGNWDKFFTWDLQAVPNLGFHLFAYPLISLLPPFIVEKVFISTYILLLCVSVPVYLRTFGNKELPLSFLAFPLIFNFSFMMGFYSFTLAIPFMLLAISAAWHFRSDSIMRRLLILNLAGFVLFFLHLIPFIIYLLAVCIMLALPAIDFKRPHRKQFRQFGIIAPSIFLCLFYLYGTQNGPSLTSSYTLSMSRFLELLTSLLVFSIDTFSRWQLLPWLPLFLLLYNLAKTGRRHRKAALTHRDRNRMLIFLTLVLLIIYFTLPTDFGGGDFFNQRLPWVLLILCLPLAEHPSSGFINRFQLVIYPGIATLFLLTNSIILGQQSARIEEFLEGMRVDIPRYTFIATYKPCTKDWARVDPLLHAASYYGIAKKCIDAGNYETASAISPIHFRHMIPTLPRQHIIAFYPNRINWAEYPAIKFILGWRVNECNGNVLSKNFKIVLKENRFSLWQRKPS